MDRTAKVAPYLTESSATARVEESEDLISHEARTPEMSTWKDNKIKTPPRVCAASTHDARAQIANLRTSHPLPPREFPLILLTLAPTGQLVRTRSAPAVTLHLRCGPLTKPRPCVDSSPTAPIQTVTSSTPACPCAAMDPTARPRGVNSHTSRLPASSNPA